MTWEHLPCRGCPLQAALMHPGRKKTHVEQKAGGMSSQPRTGPVCSPT